MTKVVHDTMSERSETESERDLDNIEVVDDDDKEVIDNDNIIAGVE